MAPGTHGCWSGWSGKEMLLLRRGIFACKRAEGACGDTVWLLELCLPMAAWWQKHSWICLSLFPPAQRLHVQWLVLHTAVGACQWCCCLLVSCPCVTSPQLESYGDSDQCCQVLSQLWCQLSDGSQGCSFPLFLPSEGASPVHTVATVRSLCTVPVGISVWGWMHPIAIHPQELAEAKLTW